MLNTFFQIEGFIPLPFSAGLYLIDSNGQINDNQNNKIQAILDDDLDLSVEIYWIYGKQLYKIAFLLLLTYKPVRIALADFCNLEIGYKDLNNNNITLSNLVWKFPLKGLTVRTDVDYCYVPGATGFGITKTGIVKNLKTGNILKPVQHISGYYYFSIREDVPKSSRSSIIGRHRLMAFTFLDYPLNADRLDVNHKNGKPGDDSLDNLEWVTRSENALHAYSTGLRKDNKKVIVTNVNTGKKDVYFSAHEAERSLGLKRSVLHYRIKNGGGKAYPPGLMFEYETDACHKRKEKVPVTCLNTSNGILTSYDSIKKCAEDLKVSKKVFSGRLRICDTFVWKQFKISKLVFT